MNTTCAVFAGCFALAALLYAPVMDAFFIWDDIVLLRWMSPVGGGGVLETLLPMENGFWRPIPFAMVWIVVWLFGASPAAFHLVPLILHAINATLLFSLATRRGLARVPAALLAGAFTAHFALFATVSMMQNLMDIMTGTGLLAILIVADGRHDRLPTGPVAALSLLALACKETAVVLPMLGAMWWLATTEGPWRDRVRRSLGGMAILAGLSIGAVAAIAALQMTYGASYLGQQRLGLHPLANVRQFGDYLLSAVFPWIHTAILPFAAIRLEHWMLWAIRLATLGGFALLAVAAFRRRGSWGAPVGAAMAGLVLVLAPPSMLDVLAPPQPRFLYTAAILLFVAAGEFLLRGGPVARRTIAVFACGSFALSTLSFFASPSVADYRDTADRVERFVAESQRVSEDWRPGDIVAIVDHPHPHPGRTDWQWSYGTALWDVFLPNAGVELRIGKSEDADRTYRFADGTLEPADDSTGAR